MSPGTGPPGCGRSTSARIWSRRRRRLPWRAVDAREPEARPMTGDEPVSMNLWGFTPEIVPILRAAFTAFEAGGGIPAGQELFLPNVVGERLGAPPGEGLDVTLLV